MKNKIFGIVTLLIALTLSGSAAYYSVIGLSKIFAAAATQVIIMAGSMEVGKLVVATLLHNYWNKIKWTLKLYLTFSVIVLMIITSAGIYGLLSASYQETSTVDKISDRKIELLETKLNRYQSRKSDLLFEKETINSDISQLREALSNNVIRYTDKETGQEVVTTSSSNRKAYQKQLDISNSQRNEIDSKLSNVNDSIAKYDIEILNLRNSSEISSELLPLKYISKVSGLEMDYVVNLFILLLIIVFDPLAISLIISANILFNLNQVSESNSDLESEVTEIIDEAIQESENPKNVLDEFAEELKQQKSQTKLTKDQIKNMSHQEVENFYKNQ